MQPNNFYYSNREDQNHQNNVNPRYRPFNRDGNLEEGEANEYMNRNEYYSKRHSQPRNVNNFESSSFSNDYLFRNSESRFTTGSQNYSRGNLPFHSGTRHYNYHENNIETSIPSDSTNDFNTNLHYRNMHIENVEPQNSNQNTSYKKNGQHHFRNQKKYNNFNDNDFIKPEFNNAAKNSKGFVKSSNTENFKNGRNIYQQNKGHYTNNRNNRKKIDISKLDQRESLIHEISTNGYECMICMNIIKKEIPIWSCDKCYHIFHLHCIKKWVQSDDKKERVIPESIKWTCPACKNENDKTTKLYYSCFCKKQTNPVFQFGNIPHSCGDVCAQSSRVNLKCPHLCCLQCHPGPCPPCEASVTRQCHCGKTRITAKCNAEETQFQCQSICGKIMQCGLHQCERQCHVDDGHQCQINVEQKCWCGSSNREVLCGSDEAETKQYDCGATCSRVKNCGNHKCESLCHEGDCDECEMMPDKVKYCCCGKKSLTDLSSYRKSCLDPVISCGSICGKSYRDCEHTCPSICHEGKCAPCTGSSARNCRCKSSTQTIQCASTEVVQCRQRCKEKLLCGRHRCDKQCCDLEVHLCPADCGRLLSCKTHRCDRECGHPGLCPSCHNVSFEELFCECQATFILPPIACSTAPPLCNRLCTREHQCDHSVRHNCHNGPNCPPCTELVNKPCPGGHTEYSNVPCFRPVATCGQPCGRPLEHCSHVCTRPCHGGPCVASGTEDEEPCRQSCTALRKDCLHPCSQACHPGRQCDEETWPCVAKVTVACPCALTVATVTCTQLRSLKGNLDKSLSAHSQYKIIDNEHVTLKCTENCRRALVSAQNFQQTYIEKDNRTTAKVDLDSSVSCIQKCVQSCHIGPCSNPSITTRTCNLTSYQCLQRYYGAYYDEFARYNLSFVTSVEKVFRDFCQHLRAADIDKYEHRFISVTAEKCQFIRRFSSAFRLFCAKSQNDDTTFNVVVRADPRTYCYPVNLLSKKIEEKYFKMI